MARRKATIVGRAEDEHDEVDFNDEKDQHEGDSEDSVRDDRQREAAAADAGTTLDGRTQAAVAMLVDNGVERSLAERALEATAKDADAFESWLDSAQIWITTLHDAEAEMNNLREAMQISLTEASQQKSSEPPLREWPVEKLVTRFKGTALLKAVSSCTCEKLLHGALKPLLVDLLDMEYRCTTLWYNHHSGTQRWFDDLALCFIPLLTKLGDCQPSAAVSSAAGNGTCSTSGRPENGDEVSRHCKKARVELSSTSRNGRHAEELICMERLKALLEDKLQYLQLEVLQKMPAVEGGVPLIFVKHAASNSKGQPSDVCTDTEVVIVGEAVKAAKQVVPVEEL